MTRTFGADKSLDEERLVAAAQRGDVNAFNQLVLAYQQMAYNVAYRILSNPDAAMDATQDAFLRGFQGLSRFRGGSFRAWVLRIVTNCSYDQLRYKQRRPSASIDDLVEEEEHSTLLQSDDEAPEDYIERRELSRELQQAMDSLPEDQRLTLILSDIEGLNYQEIAETTLVSLGTVKSRLSRARAKMRDCIRAQRELGATGRRLSDES
jgi:RNA polymerase sigma-70 factor (ECF subfamily)